MHVSPRLSTRAPPWDGPRMIHSTGDTPGYSKSTSVASILLQSAGAAAIAVPVARANTALATPVIIIFFIIAYSPVDWKTMLVPIFVCHVFRQMVGDAFVAINASHVVFDRHFVLNAGPLFLFAGIHAVKTVAVAAFTRIGVFHPFPFAARKGQAFRLKFFRSIDATNHLAPKFAGCLDLANHLVTPLFGHVTVRAGCPYTRTVGVVDGFLIFGIYVIAHLVARDAKLFGVGHFQGCVEATPKNDAAYKSDQQQAGKGVMDTWTTQGSNQTGKAPGSCITAVFICHWLIPSEFPPP